MVKCNESINGVCQDGVIGIWEKKLLRNRKMPIGITQYELTKVLGEEFKSSLPTIEEIEREMSE